MPWVSKILGGRIISSNLTTYYYRRCNRLIERSDGKGAHVRYEGKACILPKCHELQHEGQHKHKGAILQFPAFSVLSAND